MTAEKDPRMPLQELEDVNVQDKASPVETLDQDPLVPIEEQRKIIHRLDRRLITMLGIIHIIALMDRSNLSTVNIAGMEEELHLVGSQYVRIDACDVDVMPIV